MVLDVPDLGRVAAAGRVFAPAERGRHVDADGHTVVRELGRKRAAEKAVSRSIDDAALKAGVDPMAINRRNGLVQPGDTRRTRRRARIVGRGPLKPRRDG